jgi:capsular polysaccharide biosynthesis protein
MIADAIGEAFSEQAIEIGSSANLITATPWEEATLPDSPVNHEKQRPAALGGILGGVLGIGLAFLLGSRDDRLRSPEEVEQIFGIPPFGVVPKFKVFRL